MKKWRRNSIVALLCLLSTVAWAQSEELVWTEQRFMDHVLAHHPMMRMAAIRLESGAALERSARGGFDPVLQGNYKGKNFADKEYYKLMDAGLEVPTWFGIEAKAGMLQNQGDLLNPERTATETGLAYVGISVPIGKDLIIDKRRATLKKAQLANTATNFEKALMVNDLKLEALTDYWVWVASWEVVSLSEEAVDLALERHQGVIQGFEQGDRPAIDTVETFARLQLRQIMLQKAVLEFDNQRLLLSNFLWTDDNTPLQLSTAAKPSPLKQTSQLEMSAELFSGLSDSLGVSHPKLRLISNKIDQKLLEVRYRKEQLKPKLDLDYSLLAEPANSNEKYNWSAANSQVGLKFSMAIPLREERGELALSKLALEEQELTLNQESKALAVKLQTEFNKLNFLQQQVDTYADLVDSYQLLLTGEKTRFANGESSVFVLNSRESTLIKTRVKYIELFAKWRINQARVLWASGQFSEF